jgi:hypothetical protein
MTPAEFKTQVDRLRRQWDRTYSEERVKVLYAEFGALPAAHFERVVTRALGEMAVAPLARELRAMLAEARERVWNVEKRAHEELAHQALSKPQVRALMRTVWEGLHVIRTDEDLTDAEYDERIRRHIRRPRERRGEDESPT